MNYLVLHPSVKILVGKGFNAETKTYDDYVEVDLGEYRTVNVQNPLESLDRLKASKHIDDAEYADKLTQIEQKNIKYNLVIPPASE